MEHTAKIIHLHSSDLYCTILMDLMVKRLLLLEFKVVLQVLAQKLVMDQTIMAEALSISRLMELLKYIIILLRVLAVKVLTRLECSLDAILGMQLQMNLKVLLINYSN